MTNSQRKRKPKSPYKCLTWQQRLQLEAYLKTNTPKKEIARLLGVHISTVYREIKRGLYKKEKYWTDNYNYGERKHKTIQEYSPDIAQEKYKQGLMARGATLKLGNDYKFAEYIENRIVNDGLTPLAVLGEIRRNKMDFSTSICIRTLYNYIDKGVFLRLSLKHLPLKGSRKLHRRRLKIAAKVSKGTSIEKRPAVIDDRTEFGHWEMDCVIGKKQKRETLLCLSERITRKEMIIKIPNRTTESVVKALNRIERSYGKMFRRVFKSITVDNGVEFSDCKGLEKSIYAGQRTKVYYCHPYSSYERGTNERLNREIRRKIPKGVDIAKYSDSQIKDIENWMNHYPRQVLGFATADELFNEYISNL